MIEELKRFEFTVHTNKKDRTKRTTKTIKECGLSVDEAWKSLINDDYMTYGIDTTKGYISFREVKDQTHVNICNLKTDDLSMLYEMDANNCDDIICKEGFGKVTKYTRTNIEKRLGIKN